jgi:hypothetical protein
MKKRYNVNLDQKETDRLKRLLGKQGITFSAFMNGHVRSTLAGGVLEPSKGEELFLVMASGGHKTGKRSPRHRSGSLPGFK